MNILSRLLRVIRTFLRDVKRERETRSGPSVKRRRARKTGDNPKDILGAEGERLAADFVRKRGLRVLDRNCVMPSCELDLVAYDRENDTVHFIEVKTRRSDTWQHPWEAVDLKRKKRIVRAAREYLRETHMTTSARSFDIVSIVWPEGKAPQIEFREKAFEAADV